MAEQDEEKGEKGENGEKGGKRGEGKKEQGRREEEAERALSPDELAQSFIEALFGEEEEKGEQAAELSGGDLTFGEDGSLDEVSLEGLQEELEHFQGQEVVASILSQGSELREYARDVEEKLRQVELESIQDYIKESDNLVSLHEQIKLCDATLAEMEALLGGFQADLGAISTEIKGLQEKSMDMGIKLNNRKAAEAKLGQFVDEMAISPDLITVIVDGEVNDAFVKCLRTLDGKLKFIELDPMARSSAALRDVAPEVEKLRVKAVTKSRDFLLQRLYALRKPKTNKQILQQNVLLKYKYLAVFLREHGKEVYPEVVAAYVDIMKKVLSLEFRTYILALERLQLDSVQRSELIGADARGASTVGGIFGRGRDLKNRSAVFSLGDRANLLKDLEAPAIIPHIAESAGTKYPYEMLFRSLHKLLMDTATSEYLFCFEFFGDESTFQSIFQGPFAVIDEHVQAVLPTCHDAIGLMLMIRMVHQCQQVMSQRKVPCLDSYFDKVNLLVWPRFKLVFDLQLASVRGASARALWESDVRAHYVSRRYAEFSAALMQLNTEQGDGQLDLNLERLRTAVDNLLVQLSALYAKPKQRTIFLINNYDLILSVLKEAGINGAKTAQQFEDLLSSFTTVFVEEEVREHFPKLIEFVTKRAGTGDDSPNTRRPGQPAPAPITPQEVEPLLKDFAARWKAAIETMHKDVITSFSNFLCGMDILRAALTQLLLYYTRLTDSLQRVNGGSGLFRHVVSTHSIMHEIRKYSRTF